MRRAPALLITLLLAVLSAHAQTLPPETLGTFRDGYMRAPTLGIAHINAPSIRDYAERYQNALLLGAGWHRFPLYWSDIERIPGQFNWEAFDRMVANDVRFGLRTNLILLNSPLHQRDGTTIRGLFQPVFADGTNEPAPNKAINPNNPWADFTARAVRRYMPGGELARQLNWSAQQGVRVWEAWNEPDLEMFWQASIGDYARLLQVTYLVVKSIDPLGQVMFGGLAYQHPERGDWLTGVLNIYSADPDRERFNWYMDIVALHSYVTPMLSYRVIERARNTLRGFGIMRPIWLNESGVPVWDDYPGETWAAGFPAWRPFRRTQTEQAYYVIQSTALAWAAGADVVFIHQLYDDCGDKQGGSDFPPNAGQSADAFGMFRNPRHAECHSQNPQPGTARPSANAYYRMAHLFGDRRFARTEVVDLAGRGRAVVFDMTSASGIGGVIERAYVLWNTHDTPITVGIPASMGALSAGGIARAFTLSSEFTLAAENGMYALSLPSVNRAAFPVMTEGDYNRAGGEPMIMIEAVTGGALPPDPFALLVDGQPAAPLDPTPTPIPTDTPPPPTATPTPTPIPTLDPALDRNPPVPYIYPLAEVSTSPFRLVWGAHDESGIASFIVWMRIDGGAWEPLTQTTDTQISVEGEVGRLYEFALWAQDLAGNWSTNIEIAPMARTRINGG